MHIHIEVRKLAFLNTDLILNLRLLLEPSLGNWVIRLRGHFNLCRTLTILLSVNVVVVDECLEVPHFDHLAFFAFVFDQGVDLQRLGCMLSQKFLNPHIIQ